MGDLALRAQGLGKRYRIGAAGPGGSLRDALATGFGRFGRRTAHGADGRKIRDATVWALRDVSFDVAHGDVIGIVGRNGAGKSMGVCVLSSGNMPSVSSTPDVWVGQPYPVGLFRTSCTIPGGLLNDGPHSVTVFINGGWRSDDNIVAVRDALSFEVRDGGEMRKEYFGPWLGAVRPRLAWQTDRIE